MTGLDVPVTGLAMSATKPKELDGMPAWTAVKNPAEPKDRWNVVFLILLLQGVTILLPWNILIRAAGYFLDYKFAPTNGTTENITADPNSQYREAFVAKLGLAGQAPGMALNALNLFLGFSGSLRTRTIGSLCVMSVLMTEILIMSVLDTSAWSGIFYATTMCSVVIMCSAMGVYQNSLHGTAAFLPSAYSNALIIGTNLSGTITASLNLLSRLLFLHAPREQGICYFTLALGFLLMALAAYVLLPRLRFYRHHARKDAKALAAHTMVPSFRSRLKDMFTVLQQPGLIIEKLRYVICDTMGENPWIPGFNMENQRLFSDIFNFLFFSFFAFVGNLLPFVTKWPGPRFLWIPILLRAGFVPFFLFCNFAPTGYHRSAPVLVNDNYVFISGIILLGISSGYFSSLSIIFAPSVVKESRLASLAGQMAVLSLVVGVSSGLLCSVYLQRTVLHNVDYQVHHII